LRRGLRNRIAVVYATMFSRYVLRLAAMAAALGGCNGLEPSLSQRGLRLLVSRERARGDGAGLVRQSWIVKGKRSIAPTYAGSRSGEVGYSQYPAGGNATKTITGFSQPDGATLSTIKK
jgi:hypothetical protein